MLCNVWASNEVGAKRLALERLGLNSEGLLNTRQPQYMIALTQRRPVVANGEKGAELRRWDGTRTRFCEERRG